MVLRNYIQSLIIAVNTVNNYCKIIKHYWSKDLNQLIIVGRKTSTSADQHKGLPHAPLMHKPNATII